MNDIGDQKMHQHAISLKNVSLAVSIFLLLVLSSLLISPSNDPARPLPPSTPDAATRWQNPQQWNQFRLDNNNSGAPLDRNIPKDTFLWKFETDGPVQSSAVVVDYRVYFGSNDFNVYCVDADNGENIWNFTTGNTVCATPLVSGGRVYIGSNDRNIYCLDSGNGSVIWNRTVGFGISSSCKEFQERIYFGCDDGQVYCFWENGTQAWNYTLSQKRTQMWSTPAISDGYVYIGAQSKRLVCLDALTGGFVFDITSSDGDIYSSVCVSGDKIYFTNGLGNTLLCYNSKTGQKIWAFSTPAGTVGNTYTSPTVHDGRVYISDYKWVYCLPQNDTNGDKVLSESDVIWKYGIENNQGGSSPTVVNGRVLIGTQNSLLCLFENGTKDWEYLTGDVIVSSPTFVNVHLYFGCNDYFMYALHGIEVNDTPPQNVTPPSDDDQPLDLYPTITIPLIIFFVLDIAIFVVIMVVWRKKKGVK